MTKTELLRHDIRTRDFSDSGMDEVAYIKAVCIEGQKLYAVHAADGTPLTTMSNRELAFAMIRQHEMEPASVH